MSALRSTSDNGITNEITLGAISGIMRGRKLFGGVLVQAGALPINHIAPRRRTLTPSA
jgi:hypothetical protein